MYPLKTLTLSAIAVLCAGIQASGQNAAYDEASGAYTGVVAWEAPDQNCAPPGRLFNPSLLDEQTALLGKTGEAGVLQFTWPMQGVVDVDHILHNYIDLDPSSAVTDYMGGTHAYDGHRGTDISIRNFQEMDRGVPVLAAEAGIVNNAQHANPDRNTQWAPELGPLWNGAVIVHDDHTASTYLHFRRNSTTVMPGDEVERGQLLGYVGSSGFSTNPHLHFEVLKRVDQSWEFRDPWHGSNNPLPAKWVEQHSYVGEDPLKVYDIGIATRESMGGDLNQFDWALFLERLSEPSVFGAADQTQMVVWFLAQNNAGDRYRIEILRPDGTVFRSATATMSQKHQFGIWYWYWNTSGEIAAETYGIWRVRMLSEDDQGALTREIYERSIEVAAQTQWAPRFLPAGKSIRINGEVQRDTLRTSGFTGEVVYHFIDQPPFVSIEQDSIVVFGAESSQAYRSAYFQIVATDQDARTDTMWYHVVDPSKPHEPAVTSSEPLADASVPHQIELGQNYPNPFNPSTSIEYALPADAHVRLQVIDVLGRQVATLVDGAVAAGRHMISWDASDVPSGIYLYRIDAGGTVLLRSMVVLK